MTPEERIKKLEDENVSLKESISQLKASFDNISQLNPQHSRTIQLLVGNTSQYIPTDYDRVVNEGGALSYTVPDAFDGLSLVNGKLFGYYNI